MWNYDKLFADGNVFCVKDIVKDRYFIERVEGDSNKGYSLKKDYSNKNLSCDTIISDKKIGYYPTTLEIQYIVRLDGRGNVIEKLFDRKEDMPEPMPELKTGMFIRTCRKDYTNFQLGYIDIENNRVIFQGGSFNDINGDFGIYNWLSSKVVEVYDVNTCSFDLCSVAKPIWRDPEYQKYLNSKN